MSRDKRPGLARSVGRALYSGLRPGWSRRDTFAVFAAGLTWIIGPRAASASDFHTELRLSLERIIGDRDGARQVGALYLARHPATVDDLLREAGDFPAAALGVHGRKALARALIDRRTADFAAGRTVVLDGWVLARSEAQLCALLCLL